MEKKERTPRAPRAVDEGREPGPGAGGPVLHPVRVVTERTGLSSHVLRAWERRYGAVEPRRTEGGHRLYTDAEVERLRILAALTSRGRRIGEIAHLDTPRLTALLHEDRAVEGAEPPEPGGRPAGDAARFLAACRRAVQDWDAAELERLLRRATLQLPADVLVDAVAAPLLLRIGDAWAEGTLRPGQEHLASAAVSRTLGWLLDGFEPPHGAPTVVFATPTGQRHELGALLSAVTAASGGWRVVYLGADLPAEDIAAAVSAAGARVLGLSLVHPESAGVVIEALDRLRSAIPQAVPILVGGRAAASYEEALERIGAIRLQSQTELADALASLGGG